MCLKSGACCKYLTSISWVSHKLSQASIYWLELSVRVTPRTERVIVLSKVLALNKSPALLSLLLSLISRQHGNNNRTIAGQGSVVRQQFWQSQGCYMCASAIVEYDACDVLNVFYLPTLTLLNITSCGMRWCFGLHKWCACLLRPDMSRNAG